MAQNNTSPTNDWNNNSFRVDGMDDLVDRPINVSIPPAICEMPWVNKTYAIAGSTWVEVPRGTRLKDISKYMVFDGWDDVRNNEVEYEVVGSRGNKYRVRCDSKGIWSCTCAGFGFRRKCRHIAEKVKLSS